MNPSPDQNDVTTALGLLRDSLAGVERDHGRVAVDFDGDVHGGDR